jgi:hypothetical protein
MFGFERLLRNLHTWLGVMILPWVIIAGVTGLYMNHSSLILSVFPVGDTEEPLLRAPDLPQTEDSAAKIVQAMYPNTRFDDMGGRSQNGRKGYVFAATDFEAVVDQATGYVAVKSRYFKHLYTPTGQRVASRPYWSKILSRLHQDGWVGGALGSWPADIVAAALVIFGSSGLYLFTAPRLRRAKNRRARLRAQNAG